MPVVKEYFVNQVKLTGGNAVETSTVCILRFDNDKKLSLSKLATLFNTAAKDFPALKRTAISVFDDHIEFSAKPKRGY